MCVFKTKKLLLFIHLFIHLSDYNKSDKKYNENFSSYTGFLIKKFSSPFCSLGISHDSKISQQLFFTLGKIKRKQSFD